MSFDVFFQGFRDGDTDRGGGEQMRQVLKPYFAGDLAEPRLIRIGDGDADIYLSSGSMMVSRVSGSDPWHLLVKGAQAAGWVIMPVGRPTCLTDESQHQHLPEELRSDVVVVRSGSDLLAVITGA